MLGVGDIRVLGARVGTLLQLIKRLNVTLNSLDLIIVQRALLTWFKYSDRARRKASRVTNISSYQPSRKSVQQCNYHVSLPGISLQR